MSEALILYDPAANAVTIAPAVEAQKLAALNGCALIGAVKNPAQQQEAVTAQRDVKAVLLAVEKARKQAKEPLLEACRVLDATAAKFVEELKSEELRLAKTLGDYQMEVIAEARRKEQARQAELQRIENERIAEQRRLEAEAREAERLRQEEIRKQQEAALAEQRRIEAETAAAKNKEQRARLEKERLALEERRKQESAENERKRLADEAARAAESKRQDDLAKQAVEAVAPAAMPQKAKGQVVKPVWKFDVVDIWLLARTNPGLVRIEANTSEINQVMAAGVHEIKGLRIYEEVKSTTRQTTQPVINI